MRTPILTTVLALLAGIPASAATESLEQQLKGMNAPSSALPPSASAEKLYAVQTRESSLSNRHELLLGAGKSLFGQEFIVSSQFGAGYRYHLNDRFDLGVSGMYVSNGLSASAQRLIIEDRVYPDVAYSKWQADATVGLNTFYGKFRLTADNVMYFDQYVALGGGMVGLSTGSRPAAVADIGFAFWMGRSLSLRMGFKDTVYNEQRRLSRSWEQNFQFHIDAGILLGGSSGT